MIKMRPEAVLFVCVVMAGGAVGEWSGEQSRALLEWIRELGGGVDGISFQSIPGMGMGAVTTRDLEVCPVVALPGMDGLSLSTSQVQS